MAELFQLHPSGLSLMNRCGVAFEFRYIQGLKLPPSIAMVTGSAVDRAATAAIRHKIEKGRYPRGKDLIEQADSALTDGGLFAQVDQFEYAAAGGRDIALEETRAKVRAYAAVLPEVVRRIKNPIDAQWGWAIKDPGMRVELAGTADVVEAGQAPGELVVSDLKVSKIAPNPHTSLQLSMYALAAHVVRKATWPVGVRLDVIKKLKEPVLARLKSERKQGDMLHVIERVRDAARRMETGSFAPAPLDSWWCSDKWCGYWERCKYSTRPVTVQMPAMEPAEVQAGPDESDMDSPE